MKNVFGSLSLIFIFSIWTSTFSFSKTMDKEKAQLDTATFGAGCYWCVEAVFQELKGVKEVKSGFSGGDSTNPTYREVSSGLTGYAEVVQITFDPKIISFKELLEVFWGTHDPTTLNRQGADVGAQYRSAIFYHTEEQRELAVRYKQALNKESAFGKPVVTEIAPFKSFHLAKASHQDYYNANKNQPYCRIVIQPKVDKLHKVFGDKLKD